MPIQIVLNPTPDAASSEKEAAIVASCNENFSKICGGNFSLTLDGSMQKTKTAGAST